MSSLASSEKCRSDLSRWRLESREGAHFWTYLSKEAAQAKPLSRAEQHFLNIPSDDPVHPPAADYQEAAKNGWRFYQSLQLDDGHWACGYGGPSFLLPGLIFAMYITGMDVSPEMTTELIYYLSRHVNHDGGWGLHLEGPSTVLATTLYYVMLRILGLESDHMLTRNAMACLHKLGGPSGIPQWGKIWLSCLNLYSWEGINPIPPEFWLLPDWLPVHPSKWWIQCRVVYLPTCYLYSRRFAIDANPLIQSLRQELWDSPFDEVPFSSFRDKVATPDLKKPHSLFLRAINFGLRLYQKYLQPKWLVERAQRHVLELVLREDTNTDHNCLAPVNKAFHMVTVFATEGPQSKRLKLHQLRLPTYFWMGEDGFTSSGTNGIQTWDTAFSIQAATEAGLHKDGEVRPSLQKALNFMEMSQLDSNLDDPYRQPRKGGWPFSTKDNGYVVSDCAAEGLKAVLTLQDKCGFGASISRERLRDCIDTILALQNANGGFASYERVKGSTLLELLNPAEIFDKIMVEYPYVECTSACLSALAAFSQSDGYRSTEVKQAMQKCTSFIYSVQRKDGSWYGSWGICFTYAAFLALNGLASIGRTHTEDAAVRKACRFLITTQREDGGWGEHHSTCEVEEYVQMESQVVQTAWAVLGLMYAEYPERAPIERGLDLIMSRQRPNGSWDQEAIEGVFNKTCMIGYPNYKHVFTVWALGKYRTSYLPSLV